MVECRTAFVTGAASGIGLEVVRRLARDPRYIPIYALDKDSSIRGLFPSFEYPNVIPIQADVRDREQITGVLGRISLESGGLTVVVNVAGVIIAGKDRPHYKYHQDPDIKKQMMNLWWTNEIAVYHIMGAVEEIMRRTGGGTIINVTSAKDYFPDPYRMEYMRGKKNLEESSLYEARKLAQDKIRVVVVKPGSTRTNIDSGVWIRGSDEREAESVRGFNDWWRQAFGNDPGNVAEVIYQITDGKIKGPKVHVGFDAKLGYSLSRTIPFWRQIFYVGAYSAYQIIKMGGRLRGVGKIDSVMDLPTINLGDDEVLDVWYEKIMGERSKPRTPEVVTINDHNFYRLCQGGGIFSVAQLRELGISPEDVDNYLLRKLQELSGKTRLTDSCEPDPDGDWQYHYTATQEPNSNLIFGKESVVVRAQEVFGHYLTFAPVAQLQ